MCVKTEWGHVFDNNNCIDIDHSRIMDNRSEIVVLEKKREKVIATYCEIWNILN